MEWMRQSGGADTIVAIATPAGRGGIGVVRLSGPEARSILTPVLRLRAPLEPGRARFGELLDPASLAMSPIVLDQAVVTFFQAPNSYTGEDVVEVSLHGAPVLLGTLLRYAVRQGARLAEPGEFTRRAFLAGRLDLTRAEAVRDIIDATTLHQARVAAAQLGGSVSRAAEPVKDELLQLIAGLEAGIDFAEDDLETMPVAEISRRVEHALEPLQRLAAGFAYGQRLREGFAVALVGQPNAGKSSLFNRLLGRSRAIVTAQPGTTRDSLAEAFDLGGIPVELVDTAGLRELEDNAAHEAERAGVVRAREAAAEANHVLHVVDARGLEAGGTKLAAADEAIAAQLEGRGRTLVLNKLDLLSAQERERLKAYWSADDGGAVLASATTGEGMDSLRAHLTRTLAVDAPGSETILVTNLRQQEAIRTAMERLAAAQGAAHERWPHEVVLVELYGALAALDELTGSTAAGAILERIFSTFCIGK